MQEALFQSALGIESPWFVESVTFDASLKRLDIRLDFKRGSRFEVMAFRVQCTTRLRSSGAISIFFSMKVICMRGCRGCIRRTGGW